MSNTVRLRLRRKSGEGRVDPRAPPIARKRAADARRRIKQGIALLKGVLHASDIRNLEGLQLLTIDGFLRWQGVGNDTLYRTNRDLLDKVDKAVGSVRKLRRSASAGPKSPKAKDERTRLKAKIVELEALLAARNMDCISMIRELESERRTIRDLKTQLTRTVGL